MSLLLEVKSAEHIDAEENIHDRKISTSFLKWAKWGSARVGLQ